MRDFRGSIRRLERLHGQKWEESILERKLTQAARGVLCSTCREEGQAEMLAEAWMESEYVQNNLLHRRLPSTPMLEACMESEHVRNNILDRRPVSPSTLVVVRPMNATTGTEHLLPGEANQEDTVEIGKCRDCARRGAIVAETISEGITVAEHASEAQSQAMGLQQRSGQTRMWKYVSVFGVFVVMLALAFWMELV